jgi:pyridinium-3,5-bisthiocarboxylic acid mononucleotide nickel chelatase
MTSGYETDTVTRLETNLDDCPPELLGAVFQQLLDAGALDVWFTPIQMKKQRPGVMLSVLCDEKKVEMLAGIIFSGTTAFGLRIEKVVRLKLTRRNETVRTDFGNIAVKIGLKGENVLQVSPEYESCRDAAERSGAPLKLIYEKAVQAARAGRHPPRRIRVSGDAEQPEAPGVSAESQSGT